MTNLTTEEIAEIQRIVDGAEEADGTEERTHIDSLGFYHFNDARDISDLRTILAQQQEIERLREFITRYRYRIKGGEPMQKYIDELLGESDE